MAEEHPRGGLRRIMNDGDAGLLDHECVPHRSGDVTNRSNVTWFGPGRDPRLGTGDIIPLRLRDREPKPMTAKKQFSPPPARRGQPTDVAAIKPFGKVKNGAHHLVSFGNF